MAKENIRYDRQERIQNWQQERLTNARVAIVGTGQLAQFTAVSLIALGVGNIEIYDNGTDERGFLNSNGEDKIGSLENRLHKMNPDADVRGFRLDGDVKEALIGNYNLVLELTNSPESKEIVLKYAARHNIDAISASAGKTGGGLYFIRPGENVDEADVSKYSGESQGGFSSIVLGGVISEEVRKTLMPLREGEKPVESLGYNSTAEKRFSKYGDFDAQPIEDLSEKRVLIVGAGALGNFVALGAAIEGIGKIDILDYDEVETHNLNRQIMFYDSVGREKSLALAEKIKEVNPNVEVNGLVGKLDENTTYFSENKPDLILDCVDNFATRAIINYFAVHYGIPLVSGGTNSQSGQVVVYEPERSSCLDCKIGVERALGIALQGNKCTNEPDPSVIMTNEVVGGMMVGEALKVLDPGYGAPVLRMLKYDSTVPVRGGLVGSNEPCECSKGNITEWLNDVKNRFALVEEEK